jgi:hypothetical protein
VTSSCFSRFSRFSSQDQATRRRAFHQPSFGNENGRVDVLDHERARTFLVESSTAKDPHAGNATVGSNDGAHPEFFGSFVDVGVNCERRWLVQFDQRELAMDKLDWISLERVAVEGSVELVESVAQAP